MIDYADNEINIEGCYGCAFANHEFSLPCGLAYEDEDFIISQDWKIPILGFFIITPKRHVEFMTELSERERKKAFDLTNKLIELLKNYGISDRFNVIFEEKKNTHFHIWIMPRHKWMEEILGNIIENLGIIFEFAKSKLKTTEQFDKIKEISNFLRNDLNKEFGYEQKKNNLDISEIENER